MAKKLYGVGALNWGDLVATAPAQVQVVSLGLQKIFPTPGALPRFGTINFI